MKHDVQETLRRVGDLVEKTPTADIPALAAALCAFAASAAARLLELRQDQDRTHDVPDENLSVEEAARRLGVSSDWIYRNSSRLPFTLRIGRRVVFSAKGLARWNRQRQGLR